MLLATAVLGLTRPAQHHCAARPSMKYDLVHSQKNKCDLRSSKVQVLLGSMAKVKFRHDNEELSGDFNDDGACQMVLKRIPLDAFATAVNVSIATSASACTGYELFFRVPSGKSAGFSSMGFSDDQHWTTISSGAQWTGRSCAFVSSVDWLSSKQKGLIRQIEVKIVLAADQTAGWAEPSGVLISQLCPSAAPTSVPTLMPTPAPPTTSPTFSNFDPICKHTFCTYDPANTYSSTR